MTADDALFGAYILGYLGVVLALGHVFFVTIDKRFGFWRPRNKYRTRTWLRKVRGY